MGVKVSFQGWFLSSKSCFVQWMISSSQSWLAVFGESAAVLLSARPLFCKERMVFFCHTDALSR
jgi:hypothetical protein